MVKLKNPIDEAKDPTSAGSDGVFAAGSTVFFYYDFPDKNGVLYDPSDIDISVTDSGGTEITLGTELDRIGVGEYAFQWAIPTATTPGTFTITITYVVETTTGPETRAFNEDFVVSETPASTVDWRKQAMRSYLESLLGYTQRIPVFDEIARFDIARTTANLSFPRWNQPAGVNVYLNGSLKETGFSIDYRRGKIIFDYPLGEFDEVNVSYNFRWFSKLQLTMFVEQGISLLNLYPPQTAYTFTTMPDEWLITAEHGGVVEALRTLMLDLCYQEPAKIFGGLDRAKEIFGNIETLKKNYEEQLFKELDNKKKGPYNGLTKTVTVPEFTLPGGRSRWFRYLFKGGS